MPCVNLANTRNFQSSLKTNKKQKNNTTTTKIEYQNVEKINEFDLLYERHSKIITTGRRNSPIRRMQFGVPLMTHQEIKQERRNRRLQRKLAKQAMRAAKQLAKQTAIIENTSETVQQKYSDEPILLRDGDVIKIQHVRKPLNLVYNPVQPMLSATEQATVVPGTNVNIRPATNEKPVQGQHVVYVPSLNKRPSRAELINAESRIGSQIFGPIPVGHRREFFHHQRGVWIWHEDWTDQQSTHQELTIRYEVRLSGIYKKVAAGKYFKLEGDELTNFRQATHTYLKMVKSYLYQGM